LTPGRQFAIIFRGAARGRCAADERGRISFRVSILASGSSGNSTLLETEHTALLIDAGLGKKEMLRRFEALGRPRPARVDAILVSHEHSDHCSGLGQMQREWDCPAYLTEPTYREILKMLAESAGKKLERVEYIRAGERFEIGDIEITPFTIPHDAADPVGYLAYRCGVEYRRTSAACQMLEERDNARNPAVHGAARRRRVGQNPDDDQDDDDPTDDLRYQVIRPPASQRHLTRTS